MKSAAFVFRTEGCAEPAKSQITGTAEGLVKGVRRSVALKVMAMSKPGVYAVYQSWSPEGDWVVNLKGTCADSSAGALIPMGPKGFIRESSKFFPRPAACAGRHERFQPLPLKRHPALGDVKPAETVLAGVQRVFAAQIHGGA